MIDLNDYFYFVHVVEKQGFSPERKPLICRNLVLAGMTRSNT